METSVIPDAKKIAVLRANGIGDFLFALPALEALRAAYPKARIVLLGLPWHAAFLQGRPGPVDEVVVVPRRHGVRDPEPGAAEEPAALERFFQAMQAERFDLALQLHGGGKSSNPFVRRLGARVTAGSRTPDALPLDRWIAFPFFQREVLRFLEVVSLVGARPVTLSPRLALTPQDRAAAEPLVPRGARPFVVVNPGAGDGRRRWSARRFAAVGDRLAAAGLEVVVSEPPTEPALAVGVVHAMRAPATIARGSLGALIGLLARARLLVSNDSGPLHLAEAVGTPTVGLFWCGNLITAGPSTVARHARHLSWRLECPTCGTNCMTSFCAHRSSFVDDIEVEPVVESALELLRLGDPPRSTPGVRPAKGPPPRLL